jgi:protein TonB
LRDAIGGRVLLDCTVQANLAVACGIASESPAGIGFGRAALSAAAAYRAQPTLSDGSSSVGARTRIGMNFQAPQQ